LIFVVVDFHDLVFRTRRGRLLGSVAGWGFLFGLAQQIVPDPDAGQIGSVGG
jgi:hypothetical protein